jgi:hypothetical protein
VFAVCLWLANSGNSRVGNGKNQWNCLVMVINQQQAKKKWIDKSKYIK